ncbi:hypothetical protein V3851_04420 [Paenibacillus sp. M1]|uniref:Uncharacterized protein n=1 Tax=Paenibacillus haidiansis TaxID=1574488 RepID=A0ABU7VMT8_9BACL
MNDRIQEIKDRLDKATEGEWNLEGKEIWRRGDGYGGEYPEGHVWITDFTGSNKNNAVLIANAPMDIAYLLSEYDRMREALEWTKRKFEKEWTYEMGIGEVVDDIIRRFENAAEANRGL